MEITLEEGPFLDAMEKASRGICTIPGCNNITEQMHWCRDIPPVLCLHHINDGTATHSGEYKQSATNAYYNVWTCCNSSWKMSKCPHYTDKFMAWAPVIPLTDEQVKRADEREAELLRQAKEQERLQALMNYGQEESYDRS